MKTAAEMLDRLEDLVRRMAAQADIVRATKGFTAAPFELLGEEARAIVSELPEPVDEFEAAAKRYYSEWQNDGSTGPFAQDAMAYALRRAREEGVKC